jgi:ribose 5-phosphate isomerase A
LVTEAEALKRAAAERALELVRDGMLVGLGTGTTASFFVAGLGRRVAAGLSVTGLASSERTAQLASASGVPTAQEIDRPLDLAVDGADEIDPERNLVKGRGGALFREKMIALNAERFIVVADSSKLVDRLGGGVVPVEVLPFLWRQTAARLAALGATWTLREEDGRAYVTDNGNLIVDLRFAARIEDPEGLATDMKKIPGVLEHGLFWNIATGCIVAGSDEVRILGRLE